MEWEKVVLMEAEDRRSYLRQLFRSLPELIRRHWLTSIVGLVTLIYLVFTTLYRNQHGPLAPLSTVNGLRIVFVAAFFILLVFGRFNLYRVFRVSHAIIVPISMSLVLVYFWFDPLGADGLAYEDRLIEDFSFLFLIAGAAAMAFSAALLVMRREKIAGVIAGLGSLVFFVIAMEEISWFQRVLEIETPEFFMERNVQNETNLHNMYTHTSEHVYYLGAFLLLVLLPYFREEIGEFLDSIGMTTAKILLPPAWLIAPFIVAGAFVREENRAIAEAPSMVIVVGSLVIFAGLIVRHAQQSSWLQLGHVIATLLLFVVVLWYFLSLDPSALGIRIWVTTEYHEFFIAWGIAAYGVSIAFEVLTRGRPSVERDELAPGV